MDSNFKPSANGRVFCENCGKELIKEPVWLELSQTDGRYYKDIPEGHISQGFFPFGIDCANAALKR